MSRSTPPSNLAHSVHDRLLDLAKQRGRPFNELLQYYAMERFLYWLVVPLVWRGLWISRRLTGKHMRCRMASFEEHCADCRSELGEHFPHVHRWLDALFPVLGPKHRSARHHTDGVAQVRKLWGDRAAHAAEIHIRRDCGGKLPSANGHLWAHTIKPRPSVSGGHLRDYTLPCLSNILYSHRVKTLGMLLGSASQTEILRALSHQPASVGLRQVARIAGIHPHSAELALAGLVHEKLVRRRRTSTHALYTLNRNHADVAVLDAVFAAAAQGFIHARSRTLSKRARSILPFIDKATRMIAHARKSRHVT